MAFLMLLSAALAAEQALAPETLVFSGLQAEHSVILTGPSEGPMTLALDLSGSERLEADESWFTVSMDGVPVRTTSLAAVYQSGTHGHMDLELPALEAGFHTLTLKTNLWTDQDPCLDRGAESAWLRVDPSSALSWQAPTGSTRLTSLVEDWQAQDKPVSLVLPVVPTEAGVAALLSTQRLLQGWGLETTLEPGSPAIHLMQASVLAEEDPQWAAGLEILRTTADAQVVVNRVDDTLRVLTLRPELWSQALSALTPELLARCTELPCVLGPLPALSHLEAPGNSTPPSTLGDLGLERGAVFVGEGSHTLRLPFGRPATTQVTEAPVVDLRVKLPKSIDLESSSTASLWLGDRPIETWKLRGGEQRLIARLPEYAWADALWDLRLELQLDPENENCHAIDPKHNWIEVAPESAVLLALDEPHFEGLSGFERATQDTPATLRFNPELTWSQWQLTGELLSALPIKRDLLSQSSACDGPCIESRVATVRDPLASWISGAPAWKDPEGTAELPLSASRGYPALQASDCEKGDCQALSLYLPREARVPENPPPFSALVGHQTVWDGEAWLSLEEDSEPTLTLARADQASNAEMDRSISTNEARLSRVDQAMLALLLLVAFMGGLWVYRSTKKQESTVMEDIEVA